MLPISSDQIDQLILALSQAQQDITPAIKDSANPFFKSKYADLSAISQACRIPLSKAGLAVTQTMGQNEGGGIVLITTLGHSSGQWMRSYLPIVLDGKSTPQSMGSAITYMRRYALAAIVGVVTEDDDGEASACRGHERASQRFTIPAKVDTKVDTKLDKISRHQAMVLEDVLKGCSDTYRESVASYLSRSQITLYELTNSVYERLLEKAIAENTSNSLNSKKLELTV